MTSAFGGQHSIQLSYGCVTSLLGDASPVCNWLDVSMSDDFFVRTHLLAGKPVNRKQPDARAGDDSGISQK